MQMLSVNPNGLARVMRRARFMALVVAALTWLHGCGGGGGGGGGASTPPPQAPTGSDTTAPSVPANVTASAVSSARIELGWNASTDTGGSGVASYRIYRDGAATPLATVTTTAYADTNVTPATTYSYVVRAVDAAGNESGSSAAAGATTPAAPATSASGLDVRPSNTPCLAWPRASSTIATSRYTSLSFASPIAMLQAPASDAHWYVVQKNGFVYRFSTANPTSTTTVIDLSRVVDSQPNEAGLLGMAFHPNFPTDARVFLSYTARVGTQLVSRISAFTSADNGATLSPSSENVLLTLNQPEDNHNGGHIAFGRDGFLYIGFGDGGGAGDAFGDSGNGQRLTTMLGKMIRIDVNVPAATKYAVPSTNPYFNAAAPNDKCPATPRASGACPEIYASGFRNPWRWSFDRENGDLWLGDVGQNRYEEVNRVTLGGNYGWRCREGAHNYASERTPLCSNAPTIDPLTEYDHDDGASITGGYVYRGTQLTNLAGRYLFADFASGKIWAWIPENTTTREPTLLLESGLTISSFAQANDGELYLLDYGGTLHHIEFRTSGSGPATPTMLSATGCVNESNPAQATSGLLPYDINAPFWSDGATKDRWIGLPDGQKIDIGAEGDWSFPNGTVLMKHFRNASRLIETRLFMRHPDGTWGGFTYEWNAQQTDATLVRGGAIRTIDGQPWIFPSEAQCVQCHTAVAGRTLGLETAQLNRDFTYAHTNRMANQLTTLSAIDTLNPAIANAASEPKLPNPSDTSAPLAPRARAYLHTNCSFCHRPSGPTPSTIDLRYTTALGATNTCNAAPKLGDLGIGANARLIAPGNAANSILVSRMNRRDAHAMPPVGSAKVDEAGVALVSEWVNSLSGC